MRKLVLLLFVFVIQTNLHAWRYFPEGTKWTEIRLDTLKYNSWYSKVGDEWRPNFETIEYYVQGEYIDDRFNNKYSCIYTTGPEWADSLTLLIYLIPTPDDDWYGGITVAAFDDDGQLSWPCHGQLYPLSWEVGTTMKSLSINIAGTTGGGCWPWEWNEYGTVEEIKEGDFGGVRPLKYSDVNGIRFIQGIGVASWNDGECIFGPIRPYEILPDLGAVEDEQRHYRSMLVHFERDGEVLYNVWPEKRKEGSAFLTESTAWVDGFGYEQDGQYKTDDVKLYYYTTVGDTLINEKKFFRICRARKCKTSYKIDEDNEGKEYVSNKELITQDDTLCFYVHEDDAGDVWLYTEDKNVFYEVSHNTLYETLADDLTGRELFLFNSKKKYAIGDALPLGMSALVDPNGFQDGKDYWHIYPLDVEDVSVINLLDGNSYSTYNNYFVESIGPLDGPLSGIGSPNSYNLDFKKLFAFYRNGQAIYKDEGYLAALEEVFPNILDSLIGATPSTEVPVTFTEGQMATIVLPTAPEASKGKYYRLDRVEGNEIVFEQELQPRAHIPYIIVPGEDFCIEIGTLDLNGLSRDTVSIDGVSFIGTYQKEEIENKEGFYIDIIDATPDCALTDNTLKVGALRAFLQVPWDDPYSHGGTKAPAEKLQIVLHDHGTGVEGIQSSKFKIQNEDAAIYDLSGRKSSNSKLPRGIYIKDGRKTFKK